MRDDGWGASPELALAGVDGLPVATAGELTPGPLSPPPPAPAKRARPKPEP